MVSFLEVPTCLHLQFGLLGGTRRLWAARAKRALGQRSSGFKNHGTRNGTIFQTLSMRSWTGWKINAHVKRAER